MGIECCTSGAALPKGPQNRKQEVRARLIGRGLAVKQSSLPSLPLASGLNLTEYRPQYVFHALVRTHAPTCVWKWARHQGGAIPLYGCHEQNFKETRHRQVLNDQDAFFCCRTSLEQMASKDSGQHSAGEWPSKQLPGLFDEEFAGKSASSNPRYALRHTASHTSLSAWFYGEGIHRLKKCIPATARTWTVGRSAQSSELSIVTFPLGPNSSRTRYRPPDVNEVETSLSRDKTTLRLRAN